MTTRPMQEKGRSAAWNDAEDGDANNSFKPLNREETAALRAQEPPVSPWRVVAVQAVVGVVAALIGWLVTGRTEVGWSLLYGAATVVVPGALMARGMTSKLSSMAPGASAVSFMLWEMVKIGVSLAMLVVATYLIGEVASWSGLLPIGVTHKASKLFTFLGVALPTLGGALAGIHYFADFGRFAATGNRNAGYPTTPATAGCCVHRCGSACRYACGYSRC